MIDFMVLKIFFNFRWNQWPRFNLSHHSDKLYTSTAPICTGLKTEWTSTIKTTTQFPVNPGTVVEVTCSHPNAVNEGSKQVTCTIGTDFTFSEEPRCSIPGKFISHNTKT